MVSEMRLFVEQDFQEKAQQFSAVLSSRGVSVNLEVVEKLNARFFRLNPELALCVDQDGLWLCANGMKMQPDWQAEVGRLKRASLKSEMIARACNLAEKPKLIDATAGLGNDSLLMAYLGAEITLVERHPILFTLLESTKSQVENDPVLASTVARIHLVFSDSADYLEQQISQQHEVDVVYLDPMFPHREKSALVKKEMRVFRPLVGNDDDAPELLQAALDLATHRVVVKRPRKAPSISGKPPSYVLEGKSSRYDIYARKTLLARHDNA